MVGGSINVLWVCDTPHWYGLPVGSEVGRIRLLEGKILLQPNGTLTDELRSCRCNVVVWESRIVLRRVAISFGTTEN